MEKNLIYEEIYLRFNEKDFKKGFAEILEEKELLAALIGCVLMDYSTNRNNEF